MSNKVGIAVYRALLRRARRWETEHEGFVDLRMPMVPDAWNRHYAAWTKSGAEYRRETARKLLPSFPHVIPDSVWASDGRGRNLRLYLRSQFRGSRHAPPDTVEQLLDAAFEALRVMDEQLQMAACSSRATTRSIQIDVNSSYVGLLPLPPPAPEGLAYVFTYRVRISNLGAEKVRVTGRHWVVRSASGQKHMILPPHSPGVMGHTPTLKPGDCFEYYSGTDLPTPTGTMYGCLHCTSIPADGAMPERFDARVAPFPLRASPECSQQSAV